MADEPRDYSREAAHRRYERAQEIVEKNPNVDLDTALTETYWNTDWQPGDPTHKDVQENWDYYYQATNGGQIPINQVPKPEEAVQQTYPTTYQVPLYKSASVGNMPQSEDERKSVVVGGYDRQTPDEQASQRDENEDEKEPSEQSSLEPSVSTQGSQSKTLDELKEDFAKWQQEYEERGGNDRIGGEVQRRFTNMDTGEVVANPLDWNLLGFTSQQTTPQAARALYDYYYAQRDANPFEEGTDEWEENRGTWGRGPTRMSTAAPTIVDMNFGQMGYNYFDDPLYQQLSESAQTVPAEKIVDEDAIDNGISEKARESLYMTGKEYKRQREFGFPGRPIEDIEDSSDAIYSKQDEQENYGYIPYLTSNDSLQKFHDDAAANAVNNVFNNFANLRRDNTSYSLNYDGNTYDARDFNNKYATWVGRALNSDEKSFTDASKVTEDSVPLTWVLHDSVTGEDVYAPSANGEETTDPKTGLPMIDFHTGDPNDNWYFNDADDRNNSVKYDFAGNDNPVLGWKNIEPLTLTDGTKIRADKAMDLYDHQDQYADYGLFDWGKPNVGNPLEEGGWAPWFVDMALGSAPLFWSPTAATQAIGNTYQNMQGFRAGTQDGNGTYKLLSEDPTREQQLVTSAGSAILPLTERLWGIGRSAASSAMPFMKALERTHPNIANHPLTIGGGNAVGEAVEEIPGNFVEEMQSSGTIGDYFANPLYYYYDKRGDRVYTTDESDPNNPDVNYYAAYDRQGKRLKDQSTDFFGRQGNFWSEAPASMLGGAALGGVLGTGEAIGAIGPYRESRAERDKFGYNIEVPEEVLNYTRRQAGE